MNVVLQMWGIFPGIPPLCPIRRRRKPKNPPTAGRANQVKREVPRPETPLQNQTYLSEYTFDNFIVGNSNKFAHAASVAVANDPACNANVESYTYNPLFIYGPSGLGKTHLLYAIINHINKSRPNLRIVYVKGEEFTNQLIDAISKKTTEQFRQKYRTVDILLIDDIQFIAGRDSTQEEFFHTFNALYEDHKQIILTSDPARPRDIKTLEDRLKTRFEWGITADIQPPGRRPARRDTQKEGGGDGHKALERRRQFPRREPEVEHKTDGGRDQEARRSSVC